MLIRPRYTGAKFVTPSPIMNLAFAADKALDSRVTFTRASSGTYFDASGVLQTASSNVARFTHGNFRTNLLTYSEEFDNGAWSKGGCTISANAATAPDGTATADKLVANSGVQANIDVGMIPSLANSTTYTCSFYMKAAEKNWAVVNFNNGALSRRTFFNLSTGAIGAIAGGITASIESVGDGWYRCICTGITDASTGTNASAYAQWTDADGATQATGDGTSGIYIWGAQLEQGSSSTEYIPTTSAPVTVGESLGLLIEESRTNLLTYSEEFDNGAWNKTRDGGVTVSTNSAPAPDGTATADKIIPSITAGFHCVERTLTLSAGSHAFSVFAKADEYSNIQIFDSLTTDFVNFNLSTGTVGSSLGYTGTITNVGGGIYKCSGVKSFSAGSQAVRIGVIQSPTAARGESFSGNASDGIYIWGAQLEQGSFPTSYIKTTSSAVTRAADSASMTGTNFSSWYNQEEGTFVVEASWQGGSAPLPSNRFAATMSDGTVSERFFVYNRGGQAGGGIIYSGGVAQAPFDGVASTSGLVKTALAIKENDSALSANGSTPTTDSVVTMPVGIDRMFIGSQTSSANHLSGTIASISYYPKRLSNAWLQALTS